MAITFDSASPDTSSAGNVSNLTSSAWTIAGSNRLLIGAIGTGTGGTATTHSGMNWGGSGGTAMTQIGSTLSVGTPGRLSVWRLIAPTAASQTLYGSWAAAQDESAIGAVNYNGVDQTTPVGTPVTNTGTITGSASGNMTVNVTTAVGDVVVAVFWVIATSGADPQLTPNGTPTPTGRYEIEGAQLSFESMQIQEVVATGTTTTVSCQYSSGAAFSGNWGVIAFVVNAASTGPTPTIDSTSSATPAHGSSLTITGSNFGASQGAGFVTIGGVTQSVTAWSNTSITVTVDRGTNKYGAALNVFVTDNSAAQSGAYALTGLTPPSGWSYVDITTPNRAVAYRLTTSPDLANGDQLSWENKGGGVTVSADATFVAWSSIRSFQFEVWTPGDGWGAAATQLIDDWAVYEWPPRQPLRPGRSMYSLLDVRSWAEPLLVAKWFADELTQQTTGTGIAVGQASETDTAQSITVRLVRALGQASEADSAQSVAPRLLLTLGLPLEADLAQAVTARLVSTLGQPAETDTALAAVARALRGVAQALETDAAQTIASRLIAPLAQASENDAAQSVTTPGANLVGQASETELAQPVGKVLRSTTSQAVETDQALGVTAALARAVAQAAEADSAFAVTARSVSTLGQPVESDAAQGLAINGGIQVGQAVEADTAQSVSGSLRRTLLQAIEVDTALPTAPAQIRVPGIAAEVDAALIVSLRAGNAVGQAAELDVATALGTTRFESDFYRYDVPAYSLRYDIPGSSLRFDVPSIGAAINLN